ncbi:hypothetical protein EAH89_14285 [Roseomonas nepalensis]|uniref:Uncharacterized protein n=1 Tax=Muricoccus nepalensis TaxID=1854500 RepID=A0A502G1V3_9PROT|nr:hypothetical protein [Roseomonas nepalensis]TPG55724.1 hypothetical protein EAH89_14285 [Roseomonas nepalensis]
MPAAAFAEESGLETPIALLLTTAMVIGGGLNLAGPGFIREEFRRWGYPASLPVLVRDRAWLRCEYPTALAILAAVLLAS